MNNPQSVGEQLLQLQNIAYIKQFMQKLSVKALFLVTLLITVCNTTISFLLKGQYESILKLSTSMNTSAEQVDIEFSKLITDLVFASSTVTSLIVGLILPITLLYIIIRSASDNPSVIPLGAVKFLYIVSFIQTITIIVPSVVLVVLSIISIFASTDIVASIISVVILAVILLIFCSYFVLQTKFLAAVKHSSTGFSLIYGSSGSFGVMSVIFAIFTGISTAASVVAYIVVNSLISSNDFEQSRSFQLFIQGGGKQLLEDMKPVFILILAFFILYTLYYITTAIIAFNYKNIVKAAIKESFITTKRQAVAINSAFRTYGGQNSYKNYNYSSTGTSQQSYAEIHKNITNNQNATDTKEDEPVAEPVAEPAPYEPNPYNTYQGSPVIPEYNGSFPQNNNFDYPQQPDYNNMQNSAPVQSGGSFGFNTDTTNNPYNE